MRLSCRSYHSSSSTVNGTNAYACDRCRSGYTTHFNLRLQSPCKCLCSAFNSIPSPLARIASMQPISQSFQSMAGLDAFLTHWHTNRLSLQQYYQGTNRSRSISKMYPHQKPSLLWPSSDTLMSTKQMLVEDMVITDPACLYVVTWKVSHRYHFYLYESFNGDTCHCIDPWFA